MPAELFCYPTTTVTMASSRKSPPPATVQLHSAPLLLLCYTVPRGALRSTKQHWRFFLQNRSLAGNQDLPVFPAAGRSLPRQPTNRGGWNAAPPPRLSTRSSPLRFANTISQPEIKCLTTSQWCSPVCSNAFTPVQQHLTENNRIH